MIYKIPTLKYYHIYLCLGVKEILGYFYILPFNYTYICVVHNLVANFVFKLIKKRAYNIIWKVFNNLISCSKISKIENNDLSTLRNHSKT